jgi:hypothetical protein
MEFSTITQFNVSQVYYKAKPKTSFSRDIIILNNFNFKGLRLASPRMYTFGIQSFRTDSNKFSFNLQFPQEKTDETDLFLQKMLDLEKYMINYMTLNSVLYFGTNHSRETIKSMFSSFIVYPKKQDSSNENDYDLPPYFQSCKIPYYQNTKEFKDLTIIDKNGENIYTSPSTINPSNLITLGKYVESQIHFSKIWASQRRWGVEIKAVNVQVFDSLVDTVVTKKDVIDDKNDEDCIEVEAFEHNNKKYYRANKDKIDGSFVWNEIDGDVGEEVAVYLDEQLRFFI